MEGNDWAVLKVKHDREAAIHFIKSQFPHDAEAQACHNFVDNTVAKLLVEAYQQSEKGL